MSVSFLLRRTHPSNADYFFYLLKHDTPLLSLFLLACFRFTAHSSVYSPASGSCDSEGTLRLKHVQKKKKAGVQVA